MDKFEIQKRAYTIVAVFLLISVVSLIAVIPRLIKEISPDGISKTAVIATSAAMGIRLLILLGILYGIRQTKRKGRINRKINLVTAIVLFLLGFVLMDGAIAYADSLLFVSIGMFVSVFCDFAAAVVLIVAFFLLRKEKKK
jgi:drug/metabolite transporter (DMT)-like permease